MEKIFAQGVWFYPPRQGAPDFVKGSLSIKVADFTDFIKRNQVDGAVKLDVKVGKTGNHYIELNTYQGKRPDTTEGVQTMDLANGKVDDIKASDIPF